MTQLSALGIIVGRLVTLEESNVDTAGKYCKKLQDFISDMNHKEVELCNYVQSKRTALWFVEAYVAK